jgi:NAD(P)-dependent dehydrogenase (short-subunit alcohol dehydrogenase family)
VEGPALSGKTALVIGASSGIGLATANLFADAGARVHAAARRREAIQQGAQGRTVAARSLDISDKDAVWRAVEEVGEEDGIDILVIAAGMNFPQRRLEQLTADGWDAMVSVNLSGAFYAIRASLPYLRASRGLVILISSVSGRWPDASGPAYQATKAGMVELGHAAGFEEHVNGVRFSSILPGIVDTPILDNRPEPPPREVRDAALKPGDVAQACLFLATLAPHAYVPELTMVPTAIQALGKTSTATPPVAGGDE